MNIYLDIETIQTSRADIQARCVADVAPPGNYKKPESIAQWWTTEGDAKKAEAISRTALDGTWGEVLYIGFAIDEGDVQVIGRGLTEADLLNTFGLMLDSKCTRLMASGGEMWPMIANWIGHNIIDFDLRFLWQRAKILGHRFPFSLPIGEKYNPRVFDTMKAWAGWKDRVSQSDLEIAFGLTRNDPLNGGGDVWQAYQDGRHDDIRAHCAEDIRLLREIHKRMTA